MLLLILPLATAVDQVVINSKDWQDVYTGIMYAKLNNLDVHYVAEETQGIQLISEILDKKKSEVLLIESKKPFVFGYESKLKNSGFLVKKFESTDGEKTNLELAKKIVNEKNINQFIIIDGILGYNAISVAPFALLTNSFVLFADETNKDQIIDFLKDNAKEIIIYGHLNRDVKKELDVFNPEILNTGDRYEDNIKIVKKFLDKKSTKQIFLTDGEVIELGLFNEEFPILFIGETNVPNSIMEFIKDSDTQVGIVTGYDLFVNAKTIREKTGIKIILKYGQGRDSKLYALDIINLPSYSPEIDIKTIRYNTLSKQLELTYINTGEIYTYVQALSHNIKVEGSSIAEVGDNDLIFLDEKDSKTVLYDVSLSGYLDEKITIESKIMFGESKNSLTKLFTKETKVELISSKDDSKIKISNVEYNKRTNNFEVSVKNIGKTTVYVDSEIVDLIIAGKKTMFGAEQQKIKSGKKELFKIKTTLEEADFKDNQKVKVHVQYGAYKDVLLKSLTQEFDFVIKKQSYFKLIIFVIVMLILIKLILSLRKKRKFP